MVTRGPDVLWRAVDQLLVVGRPDGTVLTVTGPGADVWRLLGAGATVEEMVAELSARYGAPTEVVGADVAALLGDLQAQGFVVDG